MSEFDGHSPGPWVLNLDLLHEDLHGHVPVSSRNHAALAQVVWVMDGDTRSPIQEANARLIAKAPLLLAERDALLATQAKLLATQAKLVAALEQIEKWSGFPETGLYWAGNGKEYPMSYFAAYGSNGERDYMRAIARAALAKVTP